MLKKFNLNIIFQLNLNFSIWIILRLCWIIDEIKRFKTINIYIFDFFFYSCFFTFSEIIIIKKIEYTSRIIINTSMIFKKIVINETSLLSFFIFYFLNIIKYFFLIFLNGKRSIYLIYFMNNINLINFYFI